MKPILVTVTMLLALQNSFGQQTVEISPAMVDTSHQIFIAKMDGWLFEEGNNTDWSKKDIDITGWKKFRPIDLSLKNADKSGKAEGWFRIRMRFDSAFKNTPLSIMFNSWAASDLYINGRFIQSFGNTGIGGLHYKEHLKYQQLPVPLNLETSKEYLLAIHFVDYVNYYPLPRHLKSNFKLFFFPPRETLPGIASITLPGYDPNYLRFGVRINNYDIIAASVIGILCVLFWLLFYLNPREKNVLLIALTCTIIMLSGYSGNYVSTFVISSFEERFFASSTLLFGAIIIGIIPVLLSQLLLDRILRGLGVYFIFTILLGIVYFASHFTYLSGDLIPWLDLTDLFLIIFIVVRSRKSFTVRNGLLPQDHLSPWRVSRHFFF
jgi:hypothetical protein